MVGVPTGLLQSRDVPTAPWHGRDVSTAAYCMVGVPTGLPYSRDVYSTVGVPTYLRDVPRYQSMVWLRCVTVVGMPTLLPYGRVVLTGPRYGRDVLIALLCGTGLP